MVFEKDMLHDHGFTEEQKQYLEGFITAIAKKCGLEMPTDSASIQSNAQTTGDPSSEEQRSDPTYIHVEAQNRTARAGGRLVPEELAKREKHPFDMWDEMLANAAAERFPKGLDVFRYKFHGLFYVAPNQDAFMLRLRIPGGILSAYQARGLSTVAERFGGGYVDITTRANLQIREITAANSIAVLEAIQELGLTSRGAGADNIRNITGSPTAGIDPQELIDTRPLTRQVYHYILNHRELYGLPRKFNIAFNGGGRIAMLEDTADLGFAAVRVGPGRAAPPGVYFRMLLGGLTGHGGFARDSGCCSSRARSFRQPPRSFASLLRMATAPTANARGCTIWSSGGASRDALLKRQPIYSSPGVFSRSTYASRAGTSTGTAISGSIRKPSLVSFMQESCCPRDGCKPPSCVAWRILPSASDQAHCGLRCGKTCCSATLLKTSCRQPSPRSKDWASGRRPARSAAAWWPVPGISAADLLSAIPSGTGSSWSITSIAGSPSTSR